MGHPCPCSSRQPRIPAVVPSHLANCQRARDAKKPQTTSVAIGTNVVEAGRFLLLQSCHGVETETREQRKPDTFPKPIPCVGSLHPLAGVCVFSLLFISCGQTLRVQSPESLLEWLPEMHANGVRDVKINPSARAGFREQVIPEFLAAIGG